MSNLSNTERETLNAAMSILQSKLTEGQYWSMTWNWTRDCEKSFSVLTRTPLNEVFHHWIEGETFADKIETGLEFISEEARNYPTPAEQKAKRMERLRAELAELEGQP